MQLPDRLALPTLAALAMLATHPRAQVHQRPFLPPPLGQELWIASWGSSNVTRCDLATRACSDVVPPGRGGLQMAHHFSFGPDGDLYVASWGTSSVMRYDGATGSFRGRFVAARSGGLRNTHTATWGPDGNLYCAGEFSDAVLRFDGVTGAFLDDFIPRGSGGLNGPEFIDFGPDGLLYVCDNVNDSVRRYDPETGAFRGVFVAGGAGGARRPHFFTWGPDRNLYVTSSNSDQVLRYDGTTGAFMDVFVRAGLGGLDFPAGLCFDLAGELLYVASFNNSRILRYDATSGAFLGIALRGTSGGFQGPLFITLMPEPRTTLMGPFSAGGPFAELRLIRATPGGLVLFLNGFENEYTELFPFCRGVSLNLGRPFWVAGLARADVDGSATSHFPLHPARSGLVGRPMFFQAVDYGSCRVSNLVRRTPPR